jgi:Protein of unknown function (DUF1579)
MSRILWSLSAVLAVAVGSAAADEKKAEPDLKAMMDMYAKASQPGEHHKKLEPMIGSWTYTSKFWMDPSKPPAESAGTCERKWVMGGRFIREEIKGDLFGAPFEGFGLVGYDKVQKKYAYTWIDNMSSGFMAATGTANESGKEFVYHKDEVDPLSGEKSKGRDVVRIIDNDKHVTEFYKILPDGKELKMMEITFTRKAR